MNFLIASPQSNDMLAQAVQEQMFEEPTSMVRKANDAKCIDSMAMHNKFAFEVQMN